MSKINLSSLDFDDFDGDFELTETHKEKPLCRKMKDGIPHVKMSKKQHK